MEQLKSLNFGIKTLADWKLKAEQSLKGKSIELLQSNTYEGIILKPLYTRQDDQHPSNYPGGPDFRRGTYPLGYQEKMWKIAQRVPYKTVEELSQKLEEACKKGQTAISFTVSKEVIANFPELLTDNLINFPFAINAGVNHSALLDSLTQFTEKSSLLSGYIASDPLALLAEDGDLSEGMPENWADKLIEVNERFPELQTVLIDTTPYHNGGANAVQELAIVAATGVFYLEWFTERGVDLETILSKMIFKFSIGANFFMEIAKLRAARLLWNRIGELYGANAEVRGMEITAETSSFTKTIFDPHVNLLRSANEAFAAVLGGVQYLHVEPFDELTGSSLFSERIARNIQLILKEEAMLQKVNDPAGGSWYIESLTNQLAESAWSLFQKIDAKGGMIAALKSNWLQEEIATVFEKRNHDIEVRKQSIVGTNVYARTEETISSNVSQQIFISENSIASNAIPQRRLAQRYEKLRLRAKQLEELTGTAPAVALLCLGEFKEHKARLDFMRGFLAAGGIKAIESQPILSEEAAKQFVNEGSSQFICFCGSNEVYESSAYSILAAVKRELPEATIFLAGLPEEESQKRWLDEGINQFIHVKSNCYQTLAAILTEMEVLANEQ
ncbi:methylmalonyl-CoA mutase subunit beta [Bacillus rubiinfantis]|uniref:methylmalonyl-CoA mutase subunit beta n=1 Tax=Bacillus rubiinfantis TaxID=1499680 RepID=UPI0005A84F3F|nr:methylmalonyl-CoA mutase subunit beta [Bacillus rubiinfantis]